MVPVDVLVSVAKEVSLEKQALLDNLEKEGKLDHLDQQVSKEAWEKVETLDPKENLDPEEKLDQQALLVHLGNEDLLENQDL